MKGTAVQWLSGPMPYHCTVYLVRVRNDHNLPQGRKFLFDCVVVVGGGSEGEVTQVEVVEVGGEGRIWPI